MSNDPTPTIIAALDIPAEYRALGVEITGSQPNTGGWLTCRAVGREDRKPSAAINVNSGCYMDSGGDGVRLTFWDFVSAHGPHADWKAARKHYADKTGVSLKTRGRSSKNPNKEIIPAPWNDALVALWCLTKAGTTPEAVRAAGGCLAQYPAKTKAHRVVALPVYGPQLVNADPVGQVVWDSGGRDLPTYGRDGKPTGTVKMKTVAGSQSGLMGQHALARLAMATADEAKTFIVWKVEGPTDMLALWAAISEYRWDTNLVVCNSGGSTENIRPEIAGVFAGLRVNVVHDADKAGEIGASKWLKALWPVAAEVKHVRLPFEVVETHGRDLRDWLGGVE